MTRHYFSFSTIFFTEIFSPPVRWVAVAHPLLMRRRATRAWASCSPDLERALSFLCDARGCDHALNTSCESAPAALLPHLPPPPPPHSSVGKSQLQLQHPPRHPLLPSNSPPDPQNLAREPPARNLPPAYCESAPLRSFPSSSPSSPPHSSAGKL